MTEIYDKTKGHAATEASAGPDSILHELGDCPTQSEPAQPQTLRDAAENLLIAIGMGWDIDGCVQNLHAALAQSDAEPISDPRFVITEVEGICYVKYAGSDTVLAEFTIDYDRAAAAVRQSRPDASAGLIEAAEIAAISATRWKIGLERHDWKPTRAHIEAALNSFNKIAGLLRARAADGSEK